MSHANSSSLWSRKSWYMQITLLLAAMCFVRAQGPLLLTPTAWEGPCQQNDTTTNVVTQLNASEVDWACEYAQELVVHREGLNYSSHSIYDSRHLLEIDAVSGIKRGVIVRIPKQSSVSDHDGWILFAPERPMV